jgi:hypothetical protein
MIPDNDYFIFDMTWDQAIGVPNGRDLDRKSEKSKYHVSEG